MYVNQVWKGLIYSKTMLFLQDGKTPMESLLSWQKGVKNILNNFNEDAEPKPNYLNTFLVLN